MNLFYFIFFSLIPSLAWLLFFLNQDRYPEPKKKIISVFLLGSLSAAPILIISSFIVSFLDNLPLSSYIFIVLVVVSPIIEELGKYLVVRFSVLNSSHLDEPTDLMIYMITAAMGFATVENILFLLPVKEGLLDIFSSLELSTLFNQGLTRFASGTFLHALASGLLGFFMAISIREIKNKKKILIVGISIAIMLHAFYNLSIIKEFHLFTIIFLITLFIAVLVSFNGLRKMASICKIK